MKSYKFSYKSHRFENYNYDYPGAYFITMCVYDRKCLFGEIVNGKVLLNERGMIADKCWNEIPEHFELVDIGAHIVMPNHIHGIINLCYDYSGGKPVNAFENNLSSVYKMHKKLSTIIGSYKSAVTKEIKRGFFDKGFKWQSSYYDHIIRNEKGLLNISEYILTNPARWDEDFENEKHRKNYSDFEIKQVSEDFYKKLFNM